MKNLDLISKRILVISLSISAVLLSASLLMFSARPASAQSSSYNSSQMYDGRKYDVIVIQGYNNVPYFCIWNTQTGTYKAFYNTNRETSTSTTDKNW